MLRPGIRGRLLLLTLPVVNVVFAAIWLVVTTTARDGVLSLSRNNLQSAANALADAIDQGIVDAHTDASTASRLDITAQAIDSRDPKNLASFADEVVRAKKRYAAIVVTDSSGVIVASSTVRRDGRAGPRLTGQRLPDAGWTRALLRKGGPSLVRVPLHRPGFLTGALEADERVLGVGRPVDDLMGERIGALVVFLSSHYLGEVLDSQLSSTDKGIDSLAIIVDSTGAPVALPNGLPDLASWRQATLPTRAAAQPEEDLRQADDRWRGPTGVAFLHRSRAIPHARELWDLQVVVLRTLARVEAPVTQLSRRLFVAFFLGGLLTTAILVLVATRFVGPLRRLTAAAARTERAADFEPIQVETMDEVGQLTTAFNRMLSDLREYQVGLEHKVDQRTHELAQAKKEVTDILDNMQQAVFTVGADGIIHKEVSAHAREIFGNVEIARRSLTDLLQLESLADQEKRTRMQFWLANIFGADDLQWMLTESDRIAEMEYRRPTFEGTFETRLLKVEYAPIYKLGMVERVMVIAKDITQLSRLQADLARKDEENRRNLDLALQITALDPDLFDTFSEECEVLLGVCESLLRDQPAGGEVSRDTIDQLFRAMHTFKGNARVFKLTSLQDVAHTAEDALSRARASQKPLGSAELAEIAGQVAHVRQTLSDFKALAGKLLRRPLEGPVATGAPTLKIPENKIMQIRQSWKTIAQAVEETRASLPRSVHDRMEAHGRAIREITQVRIADIVLPLQMMARDLARELGKSVGDVEVVGAELMVDSRRLANIKEILLHAIRNAIDHGLEPPDQRLAANKPSSGRILLRFEQKDDRLVVTVEDDGRGIDREQVKVRAVEQRLVSRQQVDNLADVEVLELLFRPGFSTALAVSETSGRGVGMDVIRTRVNELNGSAEIASIPGRGAVLTLRLPADQARL
jgi:signal transduction histidine kinase